MSSFLGKLQKGMDQVVSGATEKIHETQLRGQLRTIEKEKADQLTALGSTVYAMRQAGEVRVEVLDPQFQAIEATDQKIQAKQQEIDEYVARMAAGVPPAASAYSAGAPDRRCDCGAILSPAARFCPECGKATPVEPV